VVSLLNQFPLERIFSHVFSITTTDDGQSVCLSVCVCVCLSVCVTQHLIITLNVLLTLKTTVNVTRSRCVVVSVHLCVCCGG